VLEPFGLTVPFKVAELLVMEVVEPVITVGSLIGSVEVVNVSSPPWLVPTEFVATSW
jgi:hypothetical protein